MTTKIHAVVEGLGQLARWTLTAGHTHDITQAQTLMAGIATQAVVADKAYDADPLIESITQRGATAVIPPRQSRRQPRSFDVHHDRHRNLIERFFCRITHVRRIATRYDKLANRFSSFIALVAAFVWMV